MAFLQQIFQSFVVPDISISSFHDRRASLGNSPYGLRNGSRIVQIQIGEFLLDGIRGRLGLVVGDGRVEMVGYMSRSDFVVQKVNETPGIQFVVGTIDSVEGSLDEVVVVLRKMGNIHVGVLEPTSIIII
jgi:hypothetical protein